MSIGAGFQLKTSILVSFNRKVPDLNKGLIITKNKGMYAYTPNTRIKKTTTIKRYTGLSHSNYYSFYKFLIVISHMYFA